jgi:3-deoxy-manno-octulosonate cytidylyltransferase (CMP-KDO synthetase)
MNITGIIPARYASTRLPGKALKDIGGKSMIRHVYERSSEAGLLNQVVVATDHQDIVDEVLSFGGRVVMTSTDHTSGTDRCLEAMNSMPDKPDFVINIQGDEPFISPEQIDLLATLCHDQAEIATLIQPITGEHDLFNPNVVKVVKNKLQEALYFSRATIPAHRDLPKEQWMTAATYYKHLGMYAYRSDILERIARLPTGALERSESLEQLRWLEEGFRIKVAETVIPTLGIDTLEDLEHARRLFAENYGKIG